jgi:hypothetical protein
MVRIIYRDATGERLKVGDTVRVLAVPNLSGMSSACLAESLPVFQHLVGKYKRVLSWYFLAFRSDAIRGRRVNSSVGRLTLICRKIGNLGGIFMSVTTYQGTVENGQVRLAGNIRLPENAKVYVIVPDVESNVSGNKFDLAEMISRMPPDYQASEESFGEPVGKEEW